MYSEVAHTPLEACFDTPCILVFIALSFKLDRDKAQEKELKKMRMKYGHNRN